jgi:hypothetical protein
VNICTNQKETVMKQIPKQPKIHRKIHTSLWILKILGKKSANQKSRDFYQIFVIHTEKSIGLGMDLKIYRKSKG